MAVGATVTVGGSVEKGITIVDGDLVLLPGAHVKGPVIVIGGAIEQFDGVSLESTTVVFAPRKTAYMQLLLLGLFLLIVVGVIGLSLAIWLSYLLLERSSYYQKVRQFVRNLQLNWPWLYIALAFGVSVTMLAFFTELAWKTLLRQQMEAIDNFFIWLVRYFANPTMDQLMIRLSDLGAGSLYILIVLVCLSYFAFKREWRMVIIQVLCMGGGLALNVMLKYLFERNRPDLFQMVATAGYSFPSGHAMVSLCFYGMLAFLAARRTASWFGRLAIIFSTILLIGAIGVSRIYLGVHYPSDVAAGYAAGATWLAFCISLFLFWEERRQKRNAFNARK